MTAAKRRSRLDLGMGTSNLSVGLQPPSRRTRDMINAFKRSHRGIGTVVRNMEIDMPIATEAMMGLADYLTDAITVTEDEATQPLLWLCLHRGVVAYEAGAPARGNRFGAFLDSLADTAAEALRGVMFVDAEQRVWRPSAGTPFLRWLGESEGPYDLQNRDDPDQMATVAAIRNFITPKCWSGEHGGEQQPVLDGVDQLVVPAD